MAEGRRVVITGVGAVTPIGAGKEDLWRSVLEGRRGGRRITLFDPSTYPSQVACEVPDFDPLDHLDAKRARRLDRCSQFGLAAARMAVADAGLVMDHEDRERVGVYLGSALGGISYAEDQHQEFIEGGLRHVSPMLALAVFGGANAANISMELGAFGPSLGNANSCASGAIGVGEAFRAIKRGEVDVAVAGGAEAPIAPLTFGAFAVIKAMSMRNDDPATASRPFDRDRDGFVMAEGAGVLVLEELGHAITRDATVYGEVRGFGVTSDAYHMTSPRPDGAQAARAMSAALAEAGLAPKDIDYVAAHASATKLNDSTETLAIKKALGAYAYEVPISGTKGMHGHALGASGAIELVICALILQRGVLPATVNLFEPDPSCDLRYIRDHPVERRVTTMLKNSFGFGGINAALVLRTVESRAGATHTGS